MTDRTSKENKVRAIAQNIKRRAPLIGLALALLLMSSFVAGTAFATPASGVTQTPIASGALPAPIRMKFAQRNPHAPGRHSGPVALSLDGAITNVNEGGEGFGDGLDVSNIAIVKNVVAPGGYFGWHQHGGPSWIVVTQGTLTFYDGDNPTCTGHPVSAGEAFFDAGDHTHNAKNETGTPVENYVVRMLPAGGATRVDMPNPGICPGLP